VPKFTENLTATLRVILLTKRQIYKKMDKWQYT